MVFTKGTFKQSYFFLVELVEEIIRTEMKVGKGALMYDGVDRQRDALCPTICFV